MVTAPLVGVLALQGGVEEHMAHLESAGARSARVLRPSDLEGLDGLVIPGGESTTMSRLLISEGLVDPLSVAISKGLATWGTCAGMILLSSEVIGARPGQVCLEALDITVRRNAFGSQVQSHEENLRFLGVDEPVPAVFIRAPVVQRVGKKVEVLAKSNREGSGTPIVAVRQGKVLATSFHPELGDSSVLHRYFINEFVLV